LCSVPVVLSSRALIPSPSPIPAPPEDPTVVHLRQAWAGFVGAIRASRQPRRGDHGLSLAQYQLLQPLIERERVRVGELADWAGIRGPTATRMLDGLERDSLIRRSHSRVDRRHVSISLTPLGRAAVDSKHEEIERARMDVFEALTPAEREHVAGFLEAMTGVIHRL
jgi:DNA-binding MarR family transcriptional regulator